VNWTERHEGPRCCLRSTLEHHFTPQVPDSSLPEIIETFAGGERDLTPFFTYFNHTLEDLAEVRHISPLRYGLVNTLSWCSRVGGMSLL